MTNLPIIIWDNENLLLDIENEFSTGNKCTLLSMCVDNIGNTYTLVLSAQDIPSMFFPGHILWLLKYDNNGSYLWSKQFYVSTTNPNINGRVTCDTDSNVYIARERTTQPLIIEKYDTDGNLLFTVQNAFYNSSANNINQILFKNNFLYLAITITGATSLTGYTKISATDVALIKLSPVDGAVIWGKAGADINSNVNINNKIMIDVDTNDNIFVAVVTLSSYTTIYKLNSSNTNLLSHVILNTEYTEIINNINCDTSNNVILAISLSNKINVRKYNNNLNLLHTVYNLYDYSSSGNDTYPNISSDNQDSIYVNYISSGVIPGGVNTGNTQSIVVFKLDKDLVFQWGFQSELYFTYLQPTAIDVLKSSGEVYISFSKLITPGTPYNTESDIVLFKLSGTNIPDPIPEPEPEPVLCLLKDTKILTLNDLGEQEFKYVQHININDKIITDKKKITFVTEIYYNKVLASYYNLPMKIPKHYFFKNYPSEDVWLSKNHSIKIPKQYLKFNKFDKWFLPHRDITLKDLSFENNYIEYYNFATENFLTDTFITQGNLIVETWKKRNHTVKYTYDTKNLIHKKNNDIIYRLKF